MEHIDGMCHNEFPLPPTARATLTESSNYGLAAISVIHVDHLLCSHDQFFRRPDRDYSKGYCYPIPRPLDDLKLEFTGQLRKAWTETVEGRLMCIEHW